MKRYLYILSASLLLLASCEGSTTAEAYSDYVEQVAVEGIVISVDGATEGDDYGVEVTKYLSINEEIDLRAIVLPTDATNQWYTMEVAEQSEDGIMTFDTSYGGVLKADKTGTAKIVARSAENDEFTATLNLVLHNYVIESDIAITTETLGNVVVVGDSFVVDLSIVEGKQYESLVWSLDNGNAAIYGSTGKESVTIYGAAAGDVTLTATFTLGEGLAPIVIDYELTVVSEYIAVTDISVTMNGAEVSSSDVYQMWIGDKFTFEATAIPDNAVIQTMTWTNNGDSSISCVDNGNSYEVTALRMGTTASITVTSACVATGEYITKTIEITVNATPTVGYYYYTDYTYSEDLDPEKIVLGFIFSVDSDSRRAYVVSRETPYSPDGTTGVAWAATTSQFCTNFLEINYEGDGAFVWSTTNGIDDGIYNMMIIQEYYEDSDFDEFPAFQAAYHLNDNYEALSYYDIVSSGNDNIWHLPSGAQLAVVCKWLSSIADGDIANVNTLFATTGRTCEKTFTNLTGGVRLWPSYDSYQGTGDELGSKMHNYYPNSTGSTANAQYKKNGCWIAPVLHFSYGD